MIHYGTKEGMPSEWFGYSLFVGNGMIDITLSKLICIHGSFQTPSRNPITNPLNRSRKGLTWIGVGFFIWCSMFRVSIRLPIWYRRTH